MRFVSGLGKGAAIVAAAAVFGSTAAVTGTLLAGSASAAPVVNTSSTSAFIRSVAPMAQEGQRMYGVPSSVAIAQAILESGWGKSTLTTRGNAFFGIKCSANLGPHATGCINMRTWEVFNGQNTYVVDGFRTYASPVDSFKDHGRFLTVNSRYANAFKFKNDPQRFIAEVHKAGYATDPAYTTKIVKLMNDYNLYQYDGRTAPPATNRPATPIAMPATTTRAPLVTRTPTATVAPTVPAEVRPTTRVTPTASATASASATPSASVTPSAQATVPETARATETAQPTEGVMGTGPDAVEAPETTQPPGARETPEVVATPDTVETPEAVAAPEAIETPEAAATDAALTSPSAAPTNPSPASDSAASISADSEDDGNRYGYTTSLRDPAAVRAVRGQDPAKAGALHPVAKPAKASVTSSISAGGRTLDRQGGLAKTGW